MQKKIIELAKKVVDQISKKELECNSSLKPKVRFLKLYLNEVNRRQLGVDSAGSN